MIDLPPPKPLGVIKGGLDFFSTKEKQTAYNAFVAAHKMATVDEKGEKRAVDGSLPFSMILWAAIQIICIRKNVKQAALEKLLDETSKLLAEANNAQPPEAAS
jgi:hypothetical protein